MEKKRYYIAYGSNLNVRQMMHRCPDAKVFGTAEIKDYELLFKGSKTGAYLTIEEKKGSRVPVAVWEISAADEQKLDRYEGFPIFYYKQDIILMVQPMDGGKKKRIHAFAYIMHEDHKLANPSASYIRACAGGYSDFDFDIYYLFKAIEKSWEATKLEKSE